MLRESLTCPHCRLVQFVTSVCRRCKKPIMVMEPPKLEAEVILDPLEAGTTSWEDREGHRSMQMSFGERVKMFRTEKKLSQSALAELMGCPRTYISKIENGVALPASKQIFRLAKGLNIPVTDLIISSQELSANRLLADPFIKEMMAIQKFSVPQLAVICSMAAGLAGGDRKIRTFQFNG